MQCLMCDVLLAARARKRRAKFDDICQTVECNSNHYWVTRDEEENYLMVLLLNQFCIFYA